MIFKYDMAIFYNVNYIIINIKYNNAMFVQKYTKYDI